MVDNIFKSQNLEIILEQILRSITLKTGELLGADRTSIFLFDQDRNELWTIVAVDERGNGLELRFPANVGIAGEVATTKKTVNIPYDFYDDPRSEALKKFDKKSLYRTYSILAMPVLNEEGELIAVAQFVNKLKKLHVSSATLGERIEKKGFTDQDEKVFAEFTPSMLLVLESSRSLYEGIQRQRATSTLMVATQSLIKSSLNLDDIFKLMMDEARQLMNADRSTLWVIDRERNELWTKISIGSDAFLKEIRIPIGVGFAGRVAATGEILNIGFDLYDHLPLGPSKTVDQTVGYRTCSLLCMPVYNADSELIGVTQLVNKKRPGEYPSYNPADWPAAPECWKASFNRTDQELMEAFNIQVGAALQNAKLFAAIQQQKQMQRDIVRNLISGVISTDKLGHIIAANDSARKLLDLNDSEIIEGKLIVDLVRLAKVDFSEWLKVALEAKNDTSRQQYYPEQTLLSQTAKQHSVNVWINSIVDLTDSTNIYGVLVIMDNISAQKAATVQYDDLSN